MSDRDDAQSQNMPAGETLVSGMQWSQVVYGEAPGARYGHVACSAGTTMLVVGGVCAGKEAGDAKQAQFGLEMGKLGMDPSPAWLGSSVIGALPNSSANDGEGGDDGMDGAVEAPSPTSTMNGHSPGRSRKVAAGTAAAAAPAPACIAQHCAASGEGYLFVVGGWLPERRQHNRSILAMTHEGDVLDEEQLAKYAAPPREVGAAPPSPHGVTFASAAVYNLSLYVFGGCTDALTNYLWEIPVEGGTWHCTTPISSTPAKRSSHVLLATPLGLLVYGGRGEGGAVFDDVHLYNTETATWAKPNAMGTPPCARYGHAAVAQKSKVYIFGGAGVAHQTLGDLHLLDLTDPEAPSWNEIAIPGSSCPSPRAYHSLTLLAGTVCVFGGNTAHNIADHDSAPTNELWMLDLPGQDAFETESVVEAVTDDGDGDGSSFQQ